MQHLIILVNSSVFPEFLILGDLTLQALGPLCLILFTPLSAVLIGPAVKYVCNRRL